jgi:hypothetical protein
MKPFQFNHLIYLSAILLSISCSPTKRFVRTTDANEQKISQVVNIVIINDVCLAKDPLFKKDYIMLDESHQAEIYMMNAAEKYLKTKGYSVNFSIAPFTGGFKKDDLLFRVAEDDGGKVSNLKPVFFTDPSVASDQEYADALHHVIERSLYAIADKTDATFPDEEGIRKSLDIIANRTGADMVLVLLGNGTYVNPGKSWAQGLTIGVLTTLVTLGMFTAYVYNISYLDSYAGVIDLNTGEFLWMNSLRLGQDNIKKPAFYEKRWSKQVLYHFPPKNSTVN